MKTKQDFVYHAPETLDGALSILDEYGASAKVIAGGTDVIPRLKAMVLTPDHIVSLSKIDALKFVEFGESSVRIGAMVTLHEIELHEELKEKLPILGQAAHTMSSTQIRTVSTMTGNICNAIPSADMAPALVAMGAKVKAVSSKGERVIPIDEFFTHVSKTCLAANEIVTEVEVPYPVEGTAPVYIKHTVRRALDLALVGVAGWCLVEDGVCKDCRLALGAVAITPRRALHAEDMLRGKVLTRELVEEAAVVASTQDCAPITDIRATKEYRMELVRLGVRDIVLGAWTAQKNH